MTNDWTQVPEGRRALSEDDEASIGFDVLWYGDAYVERTTGDVLDAIPLAETPVNFWLRP